MIKHYRIIARIALLACLLAGAIGLAASERATAQDLQTGYRASSKAFRAAAQKITPSIVTIETFGGVGGRASRTGKMAGISRPGDGPTTGVIISSDGYIITSTYNFLGRPSIITVVLRDGTQHVARQLGSDETRKLCLLKIDGVENLPVPEFVDPSTLQVGQWAISVGIGYGDSAPAISSGIISARERIFGRAVQTDANLSPANYGGPLVDIQGRMIGVCVPLSPTSQNAAAGSEWYDSGIGFAVPLHGAAAWLDKLKAGETIKSGRAGIQPKPPTSHEQRGVTIAAVAPKSPAETAGLEPEDVILQIEREEVFDLVHFRTLLGRYVAGDAVLLLIRRGEEEQEITILLDSAPETPPGPSPDTPPAAPSE